MRRYTACLFAVAIILGLAGCVGKTACSEPAFSPKETLVIYTSLTEEVYAPIVKEFEEQTGIWVTVETGGSNELMEKIHSESDSPVCDVMFGGDLASHIMYRNCFELYESPLAVHINPAYAAQGSYSTPVSAIPIVFVYNPKIVRQKDLPGSWEALLDSRWSGDIAFADPNNSAFCYSALATMMRAAGGDNPWWVLERFASNIGEAQLNYSADVPAGVADGSYLIGVALEGAAVRQAQAGLDIAILYPSDGTSLLLDCTALLKDAPHPDSAKQFIDFTISRDIQYLISSTLSRRPVRGDIGEPKWLTPAADIFTLDDLSGWSVENRDEILSRWNALTGRE